MKNKKSNLSIKDQITYITPTEFFKNQIVDNENLLTKKEIAKFLNVSVKMIDKKVSMKEIPHLNVGRLVRFSKSEVLAWAKGNHSPR